MDRIMSLKLQFNYRVEETETQKNLFLKPAGDTAARLPRDFAINAGYSKTFSDEKILGIIAPSILGSLAEKAGPDDMLEFTRSDGPVITLKAAP